MTDMGGGNFRVFDPATERDFEDQAQPARPAALRDRLRQVDAEKQPPRSKVVETPHSKPEPPSETSEKPVAPAPGENAALPIGVVLEVFLFQWQKKFLHRLTYAHTILVGCVCMLFRHLVFAFSDNMWLLVLSHLFTGMVIVFHHIGASILVNAIAPKEVRSTAQTLLVLFGSGLGPMFANFCVGAIARETGQNLRMIFLFAAILSAVGSAFLFLSVRRLNRAAHEANAPAQIPDAR